MYSTGLTVTSKYVAPSQARGSKPSGEFWLVHKSGSRLHRRVDRNTSLLIDTKSTAQSRLHRRVDRNSAQDVDGAQKLCRAFTGAWIETSSSTGSWPWDSGRAFTGAWIETDAPRKTLKNEVSRLHRRVDRNRTSGIAWKVELPVAPSQARGSKRRERRRAGSAVRSRLHRRVDRNYAVVDDGSGSPVAPSQARGSKQATRVCDGFHQGSRLHRRVDRNLRRGIGAYLGLSRAFTGAWIETGRKHRCQNET